MLARLLIPFVCLFASHVSAVDKCGGQLLQLNKCLGASFQTKLDKLVDGDLTNLQTATKNCLKAASCTPIEFGAPIWTLIPSDSPYRQAVQKFVELWHIVPDNFKVCLAQRTARHLTKKLDMCLKQKNVPQGSPLDEDIDVAVPETDKQKKAFQSIFSTLATIGVALLNCSRRVNTLADLQTLNRCHRSSIENSSFGMRALCTERSVCVAKEVNETGCMQRLSGICSAARVCAANETQSESDVSLRAFFGASLPGLATNKSHPTTPAPSNGSEQGKALVECAQKTGYTIPKAKFDEIVAAIPTRNATSAPPPPEFKIIVGGFLALFKSGPGSICSDFCGDGTAAPTNTTSKAG